MDAEGERGAARPWQDMTGGFDLDRFVSAQAETYEKALAELRAGKKRTHWMWFVFPQLKALGRSPTALFYGIASLEEAKAYLAHPLLGPRLAEATKAVMDSPAASLHALFGSPDDMKFRSCMTLFDRAGDGGIPIFRAGLDCWCGGEPDAATLELLQS